MVISLVLVMAQILGDGDVLDGSEALRLCNEAVIPAVEVEKNLSLAGLGERVNDDVHTAPAADVQILPVSL